MNAMVHVRADLTLDHRRNIFHSSNLYVVLRALLVWTFWEYPILLPCSVQHCMRPRHFFFVCIKVSTSSFWWTVSQCAMLLACTIPKSAADLSFFHVDLFFHATRNPGRGSDTGCIGTGGIEVTGGAGWVVHRRCLGGIIRKEWWMCESGGSTLPETWGFTSSWCNARPQYDKSFEGFLDAFYVFAARDSSESPGREQLFPSNYWDTFCCGEDRFLSKCLCIMIASSVPSTVRARLAPLL